MEEIKFTDVWTLPFTNRCGIYVFDSKSHKCFTFLTSDKELQKRILALLNGEDGVEKFDTAVKDKSVIVVSDGVDEAKEILLVRGWGYLTGHGQCALKLSQKEGMRLQDDLMDYCVGMLSDNVKVKEDVPAPFYDKKNKQWCILEGVCDGYWAETKEEVINLYNRISRENK